METWEESLSRETENEDSPCKETVREDSPCRETENEDSPCRETEREDSSCLQVGVLTAFPFLPSTLKVAPQRLYTRGWPVRCPVSSPTTLPELLSAVATRLLATTPCKMS